MLRSERAVLHVLKNAEQFRKLRVRPFKTLIKLFMLEHMQLNSNTNSERDTLTSGYCTMEDFPSFLHFEIIHLHHLC